MRPPFPGMDPWLEHPALWPDVHNRLITAMAEALTPLVAPRYYVAAERHAYHMTADELALIGVPDVGVVRRAGRVSEPSPAYGVAVLDVEVPMAHEVGEGYLIVRTVGGMETVTVVELLSPANKLYADGRRRYVQKRDDVFQSLTSLVEIDLMRAGAPMPLVGTKASSDYRILISRGSSRPRALLYAFGVRQPIPPVPIPLRPGEEEPQLPLNELVRGVWQRGRFDLQLDYAAPPVPPLSADDAEWACGCVAASTS